MMKLQFDANQPYQLDALRAVVDLFAGQPDASQNEFVLTEGGLASLQLSEAGVVNRLAITAEQWLTNCRQVQATHDLPLAQELVPIKLADGSVVGNFPNFTIEMETGTGKTYVYLRTVYELHKSYGFKKFVIVVPSIAIREGVIKSLQITKEHFQTLYSFERVEFSLYDASKISHLRNFALSNAIQILVINIDAFAKDSGGATSAEGRNGASKRKSKGNVINQLRETGIRPIEFIQSANPIVILDEPQNLETDTRKLAIARLNPLCTLRYSATHRNPYNLIYQLDPVRAYELGLVKQISVDSVIELRDSNQAYIDVTGFKSSSRSVTAKLTIWVNGPNGPDKKSFTVKNGDDLYALSNQRASYQAGFIINEIDAGEGLIRFANDVTVYTGQAHGTLTDVILRLQIEATIRRHFEKEVKLGKLGIKVLSVFFIDRVANYRVYHEDGTVGKGKFAEWFEEIFQQYRTRPEFADLYDFEVAKAHNGYFSQDKRVLTPFAEASGKSNAEAEASVFTLIMRDKERLLDINEPLRFIFSHSALREGWDNPNVFQICTLAESNSEIKKRQEIGRGLRLAVNQAGERVRDRALNRLTVIANESYEDFASQLQTEMAEAGVAFRKELVQNERSKVTVRLKKGYETDIPFLELWERIKQRTRYRVHYATAELITQAAKRIREQMPAIERPKVALLRADLTVGRAGVTGVQTGLRTQTVAANYVMPDFISQVQSKSRLSKSTVARILLNSGRLGDAVNNPQAFIDHTVEAINATRRELLVAGVEYLKVAGLNYELHRFAGDDLLDLFATNVVAVGKQEKTLFSHITIDANSNPERKFAEACEASDNVLFYIKLPRWFQIETPVGAYTPDWAIAYENDRVLYFVAETKDTGQQHGIALDLLRPIEQLKIECGRRHFDQFEEVQFKVVRSLNELILA